MKKNVVLNKYYRNLKENVFSDLELKEFMDIYAKYKKLNIQYKFLKVALFLEHLNILKFNIPIVKFIFMLIDFIRWKIHDLIIAIINGKTFNLYGVTVYCGRQRKWKDNRCSRKIR